MTTQKVLTSRNRVRWNQGVKKALQQKWVSQLSMWGAQKADLAILSLQDMVSSLSPWRTPSHVWMVLPELTGIVPSPDSILVRSCPRVFLLGCLSLWSERFKERNKENGATTSEEWGENLLLKAAEEPVLTFYSSFVRWKNASVATGGGADVQVELDIFIQSETLFVVTAGEDRFVMILFIRTKDSNS